MIVGEKSVTLVGPAGQMKLSYNNLFFEENVLNFLGQCRKSPLSSA